MYSLFASCLLLLAAGMSARVNGECCDVKNVTDSVDPSLNGVYYLNTVFKEKQLEKCIDECLYIKDDTFYCFETVPPREASRVDCGKLSDEEIEALRTELAALKSALKILHDVMKMLETLEKGITGDSSKRKKRLSPAPLSTCEELSAALVFISNYDASAISEASEIYHQFESSPALLRAQSLQMYFSDFIDDSTGYTPCDGFKAQLTKTLVAVEKNVEKLMLMIPPEQPHPQSHWGYLPENGPDVWYKTFPLCAGKSQSPIDIDVSAAKPSEAASPLEFMGYGDSYAATVSQNGHTFSVHLTGEKMPAIQGGSLPAGEKFEFAQLHLHWGSDSSRGSEHRLTGTEYPAEIHFVHWNTKYEDIQIAAQASDGLAVVGFFYQVSDSNNTGYTPVLDGLKELDGYDNNYKVEIGSIKLQDIIPTDPVNHLHYKGSLTTPTCLESVFWNVFQDKISISEDQLNIIRSLTDQDGQSMNNNYRPPQPQNGREVYQYSSA